MLGYLMNHYPKRFMNNTKLLILQLKNKTIVKPRETWIRVRKETLEIFDKYGVKYHVKGGTTNTIMIM